MESKAPPFLLLAIDMKTKRVCTLLEHAMISAFPPDIDHGDEFLITNPDEILPLILTRGKPYVAYLETQIGNNAELKDKIAQIREFIAKNKNK